MNQKHWLAALLAGLAAESASGQATIQGIGDLTGVPDGSKTRGVGNGNIVS